MKRRGVSIALGFWLVATLIPASGWAKTAQKKDVEICPNLHSTAAIDPKLSGDEKRLACGALGENAAFSEWKELPVSQRKFHLSVFLQARGYQNPRFEIRNGALWVDPGEKLRASGIEVSGAPEDFSYRRKRHVVGEVLTPSLLDGVKGWTLERLRGLGYGCPKVDLVANPDTGLISVKINPGPRTRLAGISEEDVPGLLPNLFRRYDAFELGEYFNGDFMNLTEQRVGATGQVESLKLRVDHCENEKVFAREDVVVGKPRLLTLGAGVNTEGYFIARIEWKDVRLGKGASDIDIAAQIAGIQQTFSAQSHWYVLPWVSRWHLLPTVATLHHHLDPFEDLIVREELTAHTTYDTQDLGYQFGFGPVYDYVHTIRGPGLSTSRYLLFEPSFRVATHYFDFFGTKSEPSPRAGFMLNLTGDLSEHGAYSELGLQEVTLHTEALWNLLNYSPPIVVFGLRANAATTFVGPQSSFSSAIPPQFRQYLGGSIDLRGFGLYELPLDQLGRLTSVYAGFETRFTDTGLPIGLQPFVFGDVGAFGSLAANLERPIYWDPGFGFRDETPIGIFRISLAHGYVTGNQFPSASHLQVFFSYGEEF